MDATPINTFEHGDDGSPSSEEESVGGESGTQYPDPTDLSFGTSSSLHSFVPTLPSFKSPLPTIHDHTTDRLGPGGHEFLIRAIDESGEKKITPNGALRGGREYRCKTFMLPNHGERLFMLATECAQVLGFKPEFMLFRKNRTLHEIMASSTEKNHLVSQEVLLPSYKSKDVSIVTARSIFRQFGSRIVVNGRRVRDDYWEETARKRGFTEADSAGETRPGVIKDGGQANSAVPDELLLPPILPLRGNKGGTGTENAFQLYSTYHEADVMASHPNLEPAEIPRVMSELWLEETQDVKSQWLGRARASHGPRVPPPGGASTDRRGNHEVLSGLSSHHKVDMPESNRDHRTPGEAFDRLLAHWDGSEVGGGNLALLLGLGKHRPPNLPRPIRVSSLWHGWLRCEWELPSVVREMRESHSDDIHSLLSNFVTITGHRGDMACSTCGRFLERQWGESGTRALEVLSRGVAVLIGLESTSTAYYSTISPGSKPNLDVEIHINDTHIIARVEKGHPDAPRFIDAITWVCTAIRINPKRVTGSGSKSRLQMSTATQLFSIPGTMYARSQVLVYGLEPLTKCLHKELGPQSNCWTGLFTSGIVAYCHPYHRERKEGEGLEIPFDMMVHLSGVENVYHIDGGIILVGFFTALVPIFYDHASKILLWHFEEINESSGAVLEPWSLPSVRGKWYKTQDINLLRSSQCFVGWFARANILLGTRQLVLNSSHVMKWSTETTEHRQSVRKEGFETAGQFGFTAGPINTSIQLVKTWRFHSNVQHFHRQQQYRTALHLGRGNVSVIIDSESKQIWLVPLLSVVLHLCHQYFREVNQDSQIENPLPFANPSPDGASAAAIVLEAAGETLIFGSTGDLDAENLRQLFLRINNNLLNAAATREPSNRKAIFASELMDMVMEPGRGSPLKKMKAPVDAESWVGLFERVDFVGVCANIGQLIKPETPSHIPSCSCSTLPSDRYLLAAHLRCLDVLSQREGSGITNSLNRVCRLGERVFWNTEKVYWTNCPVGIHEPIWGNFKKDKVLQQIACKDKGKGKMVPGADGQTELEQAIPVDGAVVFGGDTSKRTLQSWRLSEYIL